MLPRPIGVGAPPHEAPVVTPTLTTTPDLLEAFVSQVKAGSTLTAVDDGAATVTYGELALHARLIAGAIRSAVPGETPRVLLALPPGASAYASMVGCLMAGGTFCATYLADPEGRNAGICHGFSPDVILHEGPPPSFVDAAPLTTHRLDVRLLHSSQQGLKAPAEEFSDVAYVAFTSGSTGSPKGVKVGRLALSHFLDVGRSYFQLRAGERWGQFSNLGHDLGIMDVFMALAWGGTLVPLNEAERLRPATAIRDRHVSVWQSVPSVLDLIQRSNHLTTEYLAPLRVMSFCGEALHTHQLERLFKARPELEVFNTYGATETTGFNTINRLTAANYTASCDGDAVSIGDDVPGWAICLRGGDKPNEGELVLSSDFLSLGYWRDEDRSRRSFRYVRLDGMPPRRSYFTGDLGVRRAGRVFCLGRMDRQVKIRGERIELGEVDSLLRQAGFADAYTIFQDGELHSFVEASEPVDQEQVRAHLMKSLPFHAIPKSVRGLPSLPRNQNGKVDRDELARKVVS